MVTKEGVSRLSTIRGVLEPRGKSKSAKITEDGIIAGPYKPRTKFLKNKLFNANFRKKSDREYIVELCKVENAAYRYQVRGESENFYGSYVFLHPEEYGPYRKEFFEILKELSYKDYLKVIAKELFNPEQYGPDRRWKRFRLEELGVEEQTAIKRIIARLAKEEKSKEQQGEEEEREELEKLREWWVRNGGKP